MSISEHVSGLDEDASPLARSLTHGDAYDAIVLGAGMSGLVAASVLREQGAERILVIDEYASVGGNHIDREIGDYTFDVGSLIFQDDSPLVERFPELLPFYVPIDPAWSRLNPQGVVTEYPFSLSDDIVAAGPVEWVRMIASLARCRLRYRRQNNARDFAYFWVGARIARRTGLEHYIERFCGVPAQEVDLTFARSRMMWIAENARIRTRLKALVPRRRGTLPPPKRHNTQLVRPRSGFAALYQPVVDRLQGEGTIFALGTPITAVERTGSVLTVTTASGSYRSAHVVSTIPIDIALALIDAAEPPLPTVTLITLFFSFKGARGFRDPILYNFSRDGAWKRLTMHSDFYGKSEGRDYFAVEVISGPEASTADCAASAFRRHVKDNGLFDGDLRLEGSHILENTYPVFTAGSRERAARAVARLRAFGIVSLGKQGGFEYQPTARVSTIHAERALAVDPLTTPTTGTASTTGIGSGQ